MWEKSSSSSSYNPPNKATLDKISEANGIPTFGGVPFGQDTLANKTTLEQITDNGTDLLFKGQPLKVTQVSGTVSTSNLIIGGNVRFKVDFTALTISWTTWNLFTSYNASLTLNAGSINFTTSNNPQFVCVRNGTIEVVPQTTIGSSYSGLLVFSILQTNVISLSYPAEQIGVRGGLIYGRRDLSIGEWVKIGDSITIGGAWDLVSEYINIPVVTNLGVNGRRMSGAGGMWTDVANVPSTTELTTIMGGTNDEGQVTAGITQLGTIQLVGSTFDTNTYYGAYQTLIEGLLNKNPKMVIICISPPRAWTDGSGSTERTGMKTMRDAVEAIANFYSLPFLDLYKELGVNKVNQGTYFNNDGLHPNTYGKKRTGTLLLGKIQQVFGQPNY